MREADRLTIQTEPISSVDLMERAGRAAAAAIARHVGGWRGKTVSVLCGKGHNGGDGCVIARVAAQAGAHVRLVLVAPREQCAPDTQVMAARLSDSGVDVFDARACIEPDFLQTDVIVDSLVGTGLATPLAGELAALVERVNEAATRGAFVAAVDVPSGLAADSPAPIGPAVMAALTVTLAAPKPALVQPSADRHVGELEIVDIGVPSAIIDGLAGPRVEWITRQDAAVILPLRARDSHKGTFGRVLIVAGSIGRTGAAALAARACLRSGAGLVTVATPESCWQVVAALGVEYMTQPLPEQGGELSAGALSAIARVQADVVAGGTGLGTSTGARAVVEGLVRDVEGPLVLDADALTLLAGRLHLLQHRRTRPTVLTPHPGEMARLTGQPVQDVQRDRLGTARAFATAHGVTLILKGHRTVVASPDGTVSINSTGNAGMATAGTGDVLTGVIAAWCAQVTPAANAAVLGVYLHGLAGDIGRDRHGEVALVAGDLIEALGPAVLSLSAQA